MNDFDDVQQKAQDMTSGITSSSPAQTITPVEEKQDNSFTYAGYGEQNKTKTKRPGDVTVVEGRKDNKFAVPYRGGGSYQGSVLYGAEQDQDEKVVTLKSKFTPVEPFDIQIGSLSGKVDTLNMRKAMYELALLHEPRGMDMKRWYGYDTEIELPHESFLEGLGRSFISAPGQLIGTAGSVVGWLPATLITAYGEMTNDDAVIKFGNDMLEATRDATEDFLSHYTFNYGEAGDNVGQNKSGAIIGSLLGSMPLSLLTGPGGAATFAALEGLSNAYEARYAAYDRGVSGAGALGIALGAGAGTALLGVSSNWIERPVKGMLKPSMGWARALKENPKMFLKQAALKNFIVGSYDAVTESAQDLWSSWLGKGKVEPEDWEQAWMTLFYGGIVGAMTAAVKTKADKKGQAEYNNFVADFAVRMKPAFDKLIAESDGGITQETVDAYFEFLKSGNTREGFVSYLKNKMAENIDKYESMPDEFKQRLEQIVKAGDGATPLSAEMGVFDSRLDNMLDNVEDMGDSTKQMIRQVLRGVALYDYMYRGTAPSSFGLPTIVADVDIKGNPYTDENGIIHLQKKSFRDFLTASDQQQDVSKAPNENAAISTEVKNEAIGLAKESKNATFENAKGRSKAAHELFHWIEKKTSLMDFANFAKHMTDWANGVLPGITTTGKIAVDSKGTATQEQKKGVARSEAYAYAMEYAKSLKGLLGLEGDIRKYIEMFNTVSTANAAEKLFKTYNDVLATEIKQNMETIDDLISSYGDNGLRELIKQYARTGDLGLLQQEDLNKLFNIMTSLVDAQTVEKMKTVFGDRQTAQSFLDRYEEEYERAENAAAESIKDVKNAIQQEQQRRTKTLADAGFDLQQAIASKTLMLPAPEAQVSEAEAQSEEKEAQPEVENNVEEPPFRQYSGEPIPFGEGRTSENAQALERWANGEKITAEEYNGLVQKATEDVKQLIGIVPTHKHKYIWRQNKSSNKTTGVMTAEWVPTPKQLETLGISKLTSDQAAAVGRWSALQDMNKVYSIEDDITAIAGLNGQAMEDLVIDVADDPQAKEFVTAVKDVVKRLQNFSEELNHSGTTLSSEDIDVEMPILEEAVNLAKYDAKGLGSQTAIDKFKSQIDVDALNERIQYLSSQKFDNEDASAKDKKPACLPNDPFRIMYVPSGRFYQDETGKVKESKIPVGMNPINAAMKYNTTNLSYWINRMGLEQDKYPSVEAVEAAIQAKGLEPVSFKVDSVLIQEDVPAIQIPMSLSLSSDKTQDLMAMYNEGNVTREANTIEVNLKHPRKSDLLLKLLRQAKEQLPTNKGNLSLEEKLRVIAAIGRAQMIADSVFEQYSKIPSRFAEWATVGPQGAPIKGADLEFLAKKNTAEYIDKMNENESSPYILRKDLNIKRLPEGLQFLAIFSNSWKKGVITESGLFTKQPNGQKGRPFYVVRFQNGKSMIDMVWDYGEFEILQKNNAFYAKPDLMAGEDFTKYRSDDSFVSRPAKDPNTMPDVRSENVSEYEEFGDKNFTAMVEDSKLNMRRIEIMAGESVYENDFEKSDVDKSSLDFYSISDDNDYVLDGTEIVNINEDPYGDLTNEQFENVNPEEVNPEAYFRRSITGEEKTNEEIYNKLKLAEQENKKHLKNYLGKDMFGFKGGVVGAINALADIVESRKLNPFLFYLTQGSGPQSQTNYIMGDEFAKKLGLHTIADQAEQKAEQFKQNVEESLLQHIFKSQKELGNWQVKNAIDLDGVKAKLKGGGEVAISKDEIITLYMAEITKEGKHPDYKISPMNGGIIEENGFTHVYNKLRDKYQNFDELLSHLTKQDQDAAEVLMQHMFGLRAMGGSISGDYFIPVNTYEDYVSDGGWANRRHHNSSVFGTRLLNPNADLVATGAFATTTNMAASAGVRVHNYLEQLQTLSDLFNIASLAEEKVRVDRGFRADLEVDEEKGVNEEKMLLDAIAASKRLNEAVSKGIGANNFKSYMDNIADCLTNQNNMKLGWAGRTFQKITRTASAQALALKPRQMFTNFFGNYMVFGGLSSHNALRYNTVDLVNALFHAKEAWNDMKNNQFFMHRLGQAALSAEYQRAIDMKAESIFQDLEKVALEHGKGKLGNALAVADEVGKVLTKYSIGATNTLPDLFGLALGRWIVKNDVMANIASNLAQEYAQKKKGTPPAEVIEKMAEEQMADYMFSHVSSSNVMARGRWSKAMARIGLEGIVAFKNDMLQKTAALANAIGRLMNNKDGTIRRQAWREIEGIIASNFSYVAIQAGLVSALSRLMTGDDLSDKEEEYLYQSMFREFTAQIADSFNAGALTQPVLENLFFGRSGGTDVMPFTDINKIIRNIKKGNLFSAGATGLGLMGIAPADRAVQIVRALSMAFGDDARASRVGWMMLAGRGETTAMNMLGYTKNKKDKIVPKKSKKKQ